MGNDDKGKRRILQHPFKPLDPLQVQVVGRLIQKEDIRLTNELLHNGKALLPAARELSRSLASIRKAALCQRDLDRDGLLRLVQGHARQSGKERLLDTLLALKGFILRDVADLQAPPHRDRPPAELPATRQRLEQSGLARPIGPDQPEPLTVLNAKSQPREERPSTTPSLDCLR